MVEKISDSALLVGKSSGEVVELLGPADFATEERLHYTVDMGPDASKQPSYQDLLVVFDEQGKVKDAYIDW